MQHFFKEILTINTEREKTASKKGKNGKILRKSYINQNRTCFFLFIILSVLLFWQRREVTKGCSVNNRIFRFKNGLINVAELIFLLQYLG